MENDTVSSKTLPEEAPRPVFGELLADERRAAKLKQEDLADVLGVTSSYIGLLEAGERGKQNPLTREQAWKLIRRMKLFPPKSDKFLEAAGLSPFRTEREELEIQKKYPDLKELWIFARVIRDVDPYWYEVVRENIKLGIKYCYFTTSPTKCRKLYNKLGQDGLSKDLIDTHLECFVFPERLFLANFALYNPQEKNRYGCGAMAEDGRGVAFYTYESGEAERLYLILEDWRTSVLENDFIRFGNAYKVPLDDRSEKPAIEQYSLFTQEVSG